MIKFFTKLLLSLCLPLSLLAGNCSFPVYSLDELIEQTSYIFEGKITAQQSFWDADSLHILTAYTIQVEQSVNLNGYPKISKKVRLLTRGGQVNNDYMVFSGATHFQIGDVGLFFTNPSKHNLSQKTAASYFSLTNSQSNFLNHQNQHFTIGKQHFSLQQVYQKIETATKKRFAFTPNIESFKTGISQATITNISPLNLPADGTHVLSIEGNGFGALSGNANIYMPNCNQPSGNVFVAVPKNYISKWSDNLIQIKVPGFDIKTSFPGVGSGLVKVRIANGSEVTSRQKVKVLYNHKKLDGKNIDLISHSNRGDMPFYISKSLIDDGALPAIERAMDLWYCETGIKFSIAGTVNESCYKTDSKNVISYDDDCSISQLGFTRLQVSTCSKNGVFLKDLDIIINRNKNWSFDLQNTPFGKSDFTSTILHEMAHAHLLGHVLNKDDILFPIVQNTSTKIELIEANKNGGEQILLQGKNQNACTTYKPITPFNEGFCCTPLEELAVNYITSKSAIINFKHDLNNTEVQLRYKKFGYPNWQLVSTTRNNVVLGDLESCSGYEVQVSDACKNEEEVQFNEGKAVLFETKGCVSCDSPSELFATGITHNAAFLNWDVVPNRRYYEMQYRIDYSGEWKFYESAYSFLLLFNLPACTAVQYRIRSYCDQEKISTFSKIRTLKTLCNGGKILNKVDNPTFVIAPNPSKNYINIYTKSNHFSNAYFVLKDIKGKLLQKQILSYNNEVVDLQNYAAGIYFIELYENGKRSIQKIIKE